MRTAPRLPPLDPAALDDDTRAILAPTAARWGRPLNLFATVARHPRLLKAWLRFGARLLAGAIPPRDRELVILRTAWNCAAGYEWGHHTRIGREAGLDDATIARVPEGPDASGWTAWETTLLRATDELHTRNTITDATWSALAARWDEQQLIELPMLVGQYELVARTVHALGIQPDPGLEPLPGR